MNNLANPFEPKTIEALHLPEGPEEIPNRQAITSLEQVATQLDVVVPALKEVLIKIKAGEQTETDVEYLQSMRQDLVSYVNHFHIDLGTMNESKALFEKVKVRLELLNKVLKSISH